MFHNSDLSLDSILIIVLKFDFVSCLLKKRTVRFSVLDIILHHYLLPSIFSVRYMHWRYYNPQLPGTAGMAPFEERNGHEWQSGLPKRPPSLINLLFRCAAAKAWIRGAAPSDSPLLPSRSAASTAQGARQSAQQSGQWERGSPHTPRPTTTRLAAHFKKGAATFPFPRPHLAITRPSQYRFLW